MGANSIGLDCDLLQWGPEGPLPQGQALLVLTECVINAGCHHLASLCKTGSGQPQCIYLTQGLVNVWYFSVHWFSSFLDTMVITK